ncbi:hypothetical protein ACO34A_00690 [Rhizobium sp. ACO-34A]|nr:DUF6030 family protein [Rhizobium sp. ACO-34A]ATN32328.1 hypothetical protein ACO34A_00690 [Rhizobium sp. ACO-34A]
MTPEPSPQGSSKPKRPAWKTPFVIFFLVFTIPIAATVLFANGGRNLNKLAAIFHIDLSPKKEEVVVRKGRVHAPPARPPALSRTFSPSETTRLVPMNLNRTGEEICLGLTSVTPDATPTFTPAGDDVWECTASIAFPDTANSIFLQIRGVEQRARTIRVKYNLIDPLHVDEMFNQSVQLIRYIRPEIAAIDLTGMKTTMGTGKEKYIMLGTDRISLKQELMDARRYNLLITAAQ